MTLAHSHEGLCDLYDVISWGFGFLMCVLVDLAVKSWLNTITFIQNLVSFF